MRKMSEGERAALRGITLDIPGDLEITLWQGTDGLWRMETCEFVHEALTAPTLLRELADILEGVVELTDADIVGAG